MKVQVNPSIFRDYDIRGIYPTEVNERSYYIIARALAQYLKVSEIALGYDCRTSSNKLHEAFVNGLVDSGVNVVDLGLISTEIHNFASGKYKFSANVIVSASHNPPEYNGLKILTAGVAAIHGGRGLPQIKELVLIQKFPAAKIKGTVRSLSIIMEWIDHALTFIDRDNLRKLKIVVDAGNGMGGISWLEISKKLPIDIIPLYFEPDGRFPNHLPDPLNHNNLRDLISKIKEEKADLGLAIDGDADRLFVLDEEGRAISGTITSAIISDYLLQKFGASTILYNAVCGKIVGETINKQGGKPIRVRVGHSFIKEAMKKNDALFAGEHSGHFYFKENYYADSSLIAGLIIIQLLSENNKPFSQIVAEFDKYFSSGEINFKTKNVSKVLKESEEHFSDAVSIDHLDGLSVWYNDWWFNMRASKTEPLLRLNLEADTKELLRDKIKEVSDFIL